MKKFWKAFFIIVLVSLVSAETTEKEEVKITLQQAIDEALTNNDLLKKSQSEVEGAVALVGKIKSNEKWLSLLNDIFFYFTS